MTEETKQYIKQLADELALASHQAKDSEVSGLFADIKNELKVLNAKLIDFEQRAVHWDITTRIVYGLVTIMLISLIGALIALVVK